MPSCDIFRDFRESGGITLLPVKFFTNLRDLSLGLTAMPPFLGPDRATLVIPSFGRFSTIRSNCHAAAGARFKGKLTQRHEAERGAFARGFHDFLRPTGMKLIPVGPFINLRDLSFGVTAMPRMQFGQNVLAKSRSGTSCLRVTFFVIFASLAG